MLILLLGWHPQLVGTEETLPVRSFPRFKVRDRQDLFMKGTLGIPMWHRTSFDNLASGIDVHLSLCRNLEGCKPMAHTGISSGVHCRRSVEEGFPSKDACTAPIVLVVTASTADR